MDEMDKLYTHDACILIKQGGAQRNQYSIITQVLVDKQCVENSRKHRQMRQMGNRMCYYFYKMGGSDKVTLSRVMKEMKEGSYATTSRDPNRKLKVLNSIKIMAGISPSFL